MTTMTSVEYWRSILAANIRAERARAALSQQEVADGMRELGFVGWFSQTLSKVECGDRRVLAEEILGLAQVLKTPVGALTGT